MITSYEEERNRPCDSCGANPGEPCIAIHGSGGQTHHHGPRRGDYHSTDPEQHAKRRAERLAMLSGKSPEITVEALWRWITSAALVLRAVNIPEDMLVEKQELLNTFNSWIRESQACQKWVQDQLAKERT